MCVVEVSLSLIESSCEVPEVEVGAVKYCFEG